MTGGRRDVEDDLRHLLSRDAVIGEKQLRRSSATGGVDAVLDYLVSRAYGSPDGWHTRTRVSGRVAMDRPRAGNRLTKCVPPRIVAA